MLIKSESGRKKNKSVYDYLSFVSGNNKSGGKNVKAEMRQRAIPARHREPARTGEAGGSFLSRPMPLRP